MRAILGGENGVPQKAQPAETEGPIHVGHDLLGQDLGSQTAGSAAFVGGTPRWRGSTLAFLSFLWLVGSGGSIHV